MSWIPEIVKSNENLWCLSFLNAHRSIFMIVSFKIFMFGWSKFIKRIGLVVCQVENNI